MTYFYKPLHQETCKHTVYSIPKSLTMKIMGFIKWCSNGYNCDIFSKQFGKKTCPSVGDIVDQLLLPLNSSKRVRQITLQNFTLMLVSFKNTLLNLVTAIRPSHHTTKKTTKHFRENAKHFYNTLTNNTRIVLSSILY